MDDENKVKFVRDLFFHGQLIGEVFTEEMTALVNRNKEFTLKNDSEVIANQKRAMLALADRIFASIDSMDIHPKLSGEFLMITSRFADLIYSESIRLKREHKVVDK